MLWEFKASFPLRHLMRWTERKSSSLQATCALRCTRQPIWLQNKFSAFSNVHLNARSLLQWQRLRA